MGEFTRSASNEVNGDLDLTPVSYRITESRDDKSNGLLPEFRRVVPNHADTGRIREFEVVKIDEAERPTPVPSFFSLVIRGSITLQEYHRRTP